MNSNDFEKELKAQPFRTVPPEWKREILKAIAPETKHSSRSWFGMRELLWPSPLAWGALAAIWIGLAGINLAMRDTEDGRETAQTDYARVRLALAQKRQLQADTEETFAQQKTEAVKPRSYARPQSVAG